MTDLTAAIAEKPRYDGGSVVNLLASIVAACGGAPLPYPRLAEPRLLPRRKIVLIVVDGLGYDFLCGVAQAPVMRAHLARRLTTVFPPTTASAVTSFLTGLAPQQHGLTGWFMYLRELGRVVTVLPFKRRDNGEPLARLGVEPRGLFGHTPLFDLLARPSYSVTPRDIAGSPFNVAHSGKAVPRPYRSLGGFFAAIEQALGDTADPVYVYAYWSELDHLAHLHGIASSRPQAHVAAFDAAFGDFLERVAGRDALVLLTADHGFVDIAAGGAIEMKDHPALRAMLREPLCGEPRTAYCYVVPRRRDDFVRYTEAVLAGAVTCVASEELIAAGYFGPGEPHPELASRVGDFALLARPGFALFERGERDRGPLPIGVHGGGSAAELGVPLVIVAP